LTKLTFLALFALLVILMIFALVVHPVVKLLRGGRPRKRSGGEATTAP